MPSQAPVNGPQAVDERTRFVHVTSLARPGYVEFRFAIGDPTLYLEMILPQTAFDEFCVTQRAVRLTAAEAATVEQDRGKWAGDDRTDPWGNPHVD